MYEIFYQFRNVPNAALYQTEPRNEAIRFKQLRIYYTGFYKKIKCFLIFCKNILCLMLKDLDYACHMVFD